MNTHSHEAILLTAKSAKTSLGLPAILETIQRTKAAELNWLILAVEMEGDLPDINVLDFERQVNSGPQAYTIDWPDLQQLAKRVRSFTELLLAAGPSVGDLDRGRCLSSMNEFSLVISGLQDSHWEVYSGLKDVIRALRNRFEQEPDVTIGKPELDVQGQHV